MPISVDEKQRLFAKLEARGWTWRKDSLYGPNGDYDVRRDDTWGRGGIANFRQAMTWSSSGNDRPVLVQCLNELWTEMTAGIHAATADYENWLRDEWVPLIDDDLSLKHQTMRDSVFAFFLATFPRWAQHWPWGSSELAAAPEVVSVGDLHVDNFGIWRDAEGILTWGIYDFDEAYPLPYTSDLTRLATSACLAVRTGQMSLPWSEACEAVLRGYASALEQGGCRHTADAVDSELRVIADSPRHQAEFWAELDELPEVMPAPPDRDWLPLAGRWPEGSENSLRSTVLGIPERAVALIKRLIPEGQVVYHAAGGVGSLNNLGRRQYVALGRSDEERIAVVARELPPPAHYWAKPPGPSEDPHGKIMVGASCLYPELRAAAGRFADPWLRLDKIIPQWHILARAVVPDPQGLEDLEFVRVPLDPDELKELETVEQVGRPRWLARRLSPDRRRIELAQLPKHRDERKLLEAMGRETANVHIGSTDAVDAVKADLQQRGPRWLERAVEAIVQAVEDDWRQWMSGHV